jgi:pimeloyl-ACP methyl ester carboxylesterase
MSMSTAASTDGLASQLAVVTQGLWFGDDERPAFGWLSRPEGELGRPSSGVVIAPPFGYAYWGSHRTLRVLAESIARNGHAVLRIDYDGTGDSAGDQWDGARVEAWRATVRHAAAELRGMGVERLTIAGVRIGATLALLEGGGLGADAIVAWLPVKDGRRYGRELRLLAEPIPEAADPLHPAGTLTFA